MNKEFIAAYEEMLKTIEDYKANDGELKDYYGESCLDIDDFTSARLSHLRALLNQVKKRQS